MKTLFRRGAILASMIVYESVSAALLPPLDMGFQTAQTVVSQSSKLEVKCAYLVRYAENDEATIYREFDIPVSLTQVENGFHLSSTSSLNIRRPFIKPMFPSEFLNCHLTLKMNVMDTNGEETQGLFKMPLSNDESSNLETLKNLASQPLKLTQ